MITISMDEIRPEDVEDVSYGDSEDMNDWEDEQLMSLFFDTWRKYNEEGGTPGASDAQHMVGSKKVLLNRGYSIDEERGVIIDEN